MASRVKHAFWLNPEPRHNWGVGDSAASAYSQSIDMVECRNLKQRGDFVHGRL